MTHSQASDWSIWVTWPGTGLWLVTAHITALSLAGSDTPWWLLLASDILNWEKLNTFSASGHSFLSHHHSLTASHVPRKWNSKSKDFWELRKLWVVVVTASHFLRPRNISQMHWVTASIPDMSPGHNCSLSVGSHDNEWWVQLISQCAVVHQSQKDH